MGRAKARGVGCCFGGTLFSFIAAHMERPKDERPLSATFQAAPADFSAEGELMLFIFESQISALKEVIATQSNLEAGQVMGAFQLLRSNDLIWSPVVRAYTIGETPLEMNNLMSRKADSNRMPVQMHAQYLLFLVLNNDRPERRHRVDGLVVPLPSVFCCWHGNRSNCTMYVRLQDSQPRPCRCDLRADKRWPQRRSDLRTRSRKAAFPPADHALQRSCVDTGRAV